MNISIYKNSEKVLDKEIKINDYSIQNRVKIKEHLLMLAITPFMLKSWFVALVVANPILLKYQDFLNQLSTQGFLHDNYNYCICQLMIIAQEIGADGMKVVEVILKHLLME